MGGGIFFTLIGGVLIAFACSAPAPSATAPEILADGSGPAEVQGAVLEQSPDILFLQGYQEGIQVEDWSVAIEHFEDALGLGPSEMTREQLNFWLAYSVLKEAITVQEPQTVGTAEAALPRFREAQALFQDAAAYAQEQDLEDTRQRLLGNTGIYIEIQEAIIRRGRR